jgi:hypothetical protein
MSGTHLKKIGKTRRTDAEILLHKLSEFSSGSIKPIGNKRLRGGLGWEEGRYNNAKKRLFDQKKIVAGAGNGGSVRLVAPFLSKGLSLFISYSHTDEGIKTELLKHLEPLRRLGLIEAWNDRKLKPGEEWDKVISSKLEEADIVLLLVSIDFINSSYCYDIELKQALDRHDAKEARVVPVILRACMWQDALFAKLQALPKDGRAVSLWPDPDAALLNIAEGVRKVAEEILESR